MPQQVVLPERPEVVFGVFNRYGKKPDQQNTDRYADSKYYVGWTVTPHYAGPRVVTPEQHEVAARLERNIDAWQRRLTFMKRDALTIHDVLVNRFIQRVLSDSWAYQFQFVDGSMVSIERTRGYGIANMEGPTEGPFVIRRILADMRTFRLEDGRSLVFNARQQMINSTIPQWIIDQYFPP